MSVVVLTGNQGNQRALCHRIAAVCDVAAIVISDNVPRKAPSFSKRMKSLVQRVGTRLGGREFVDVWQKLQTHYDESFSQFPDVPLIKVRNVNDAATIETLKKFSPAVTAVSGTNLVGRKVIEASAKTVNLHTGISPYVKGGPNCTNWCLAKNWFHLIGNTVMWIDLGIDTGRLICTERTNLDGSETLFELHLKVMDHAHDLYGRSIRRISEGLPVPDVAQSEIADGTTFFTADWTPFEQRAALKNFKINYAEFFAKNKIALPEFSDVRLVPLNV